MKHGEECGACVDVCGVCGSQAWAMCLAGLRRVAATT
jgi:hypothetical protein